MDDRSNRKFRFLLALMVLLSTICCYAIASKKTQSKFEQILKTYQLIGDFKISPAEREISKDFFWRYPFPLPKASFEVDMSLGDKELELPISHGQSKAIEHLNFGRVLFREGKFEEARKVWLSARARYGKENPFHKRNDYFIALGHLRLTEELIKKLQGDSFHPDVRVKYTNVSTFLSWAFIKKRDVVDEQLTEVTPKALYNLAAIYYRYDRYNSAHRTALQGLHFLRTYGQKNFRPQLRRMIAETWIRDRQYLEAIREFDTMLRQEKNPEQAAHIFARIGDVYFDLNKYELAEEAYRWSQEINKEIGYILPLSFILRGESVFWIGKFSQAQSLLQYGIDSISHKSAKESVSNRFRAWASLRIADAYLARSRTNRKQTTKLLNQAKLAYYKVEHQFPKSEASAIAKIRRACLGLPQYEGNNIKHARELLSGSLSRVDVPMQAAELAASCEVMSYGNREKGQRFVDQVKQFYRRYPKSRYLRQYYKPLEEIKASHLDELIRQNKYHSSILFYESHKSSLFKEVNEFRGAGLFKAYMETKQAKKAAHFWSDFNKTAAKYPHNILISFTFLGEITEIDGNEKKWRKESRALLKIIDPNKIPLQLNEGTELYIHRILRTRLKDLHLSWIYSHSKRWGETNAATLCQISYPILSIWEKNRKSRNSRGKDVIWFEVQEQIKTHLPALFSRSLDCSEGLLNLEAKLGQTRGRIEAYAREWMKRLEWPQKRITSPLIWQAAESLFQRNGKNATSTKLWQDLTKLDAAANPEATFAKGRLETTETQSEKLWQ